MKYPMIEKAKIEAYMMFCGIAIPCDKSTVDGGTIRSEKIIRFNRKIQRQTTQAKLEKVKSRFVGGEDKMRCKVGKPGSSERLAALELQYASLAKNEMSPFEE